MIFFFVDSLYQVNQTNMQCTSFIPVYYQPRSATGAASGFPWHLLNSNANYGDQRGFSGSSPASNAFQYSSYDKDVMRQIMQSHEATFRFQVQELHRLYKRQRELMEEARMRETIAQQLRSQPAESIQCLSQPRSDISQTSHTPSWLLRDHSHTKLSDPTVENNHRSPNSAMDNFPGQRVNNCNRVNFWALGSKENGKRILDLHVPPDVFCNNEGKQFREGNLLDNPNKLLKVQPTSDSEIGSVKPGELSNFNSSSGRVNCLIDLNEPVPLESLSSNSTAAFGTHNSHMENIYNDPASGSDEAKPEAQNPNSRLLKCEAISDGKNSSIGIDLNSMPINCFSEAEATLENLPDCKGQWTGDISVNNKIMKSETDIDLNTGVVGEHSRTSKSESKIEEFSSGGKSEEIQPQTPLLSEAGEKKPPVEPNVVAAETLIAISSSGEHMEVEIPFPPGHSGECCLYWFAEIASSNGEDEVMNLAKKIAAGKGVEAGAFPTSSKEYREGYPETGRQRRNTSKKPSVKTRKCVSSDAIKKTMSSISKQPATRSRQGILQSWGKMRKRQGGYRRRTSKFFIIN